MQELHCIILAAGMGTRMQSSMPKVMHKCAGLSLLGHVLTMTHTLKAANVIVVNGPDTPKIAEEAITILPDVKIAIQESRNGTGHAVGMALPYLKTSKGTTVVLYGDVPLVQKTTLKTLLNSVTDEQPVSVLGFNAENPFGYGRLVEDAKNGLSAIIEEKDANAAQRAITLCNSGIIAIDNQLLQALQPKIGNDNAAKEYYLTDLVSLAVEAGHRVGCTVCDDEAEVLGVNTRVQLAQIETIMQDRLRKEAMENGATLIDPETVYFSHDTKVGRDVVIEPNCYFGPNVKIADNVTIKGFCHFENTEIRDNAVIGPYARLRPGTNIGEGAKVGNFVETKNAKVAKGAKINHLSYVGDSIIGEGANIGAGTITCNYDGFNKNTTEIGAGAFIGSNSSLIAPVKIGAGAYIGTASVVSRKVSENALYLARPEAVEKENWAKRFRNAHMRKKSK